MTGYKNFSDFCRGLVSSFNLDVRWGLQKLPKEL